MHRTGLLFFLSSSLILWLLSQRVTAQPTLLYTDYYPAIGANYTDGSTYQGNLKLLLSTLSFNATNSSGFYNTTIGQNPDTVYGLFLCIGDITSEECDLCVKMAAGHITQYCPNKKVAIIWHDLCMLRYSNQFIFSTLQEHVKVHMGTGISESKFHQVEKTLGKLMEGLVKRAAFKSTRMYAAGRKNDMYGLVQCTLDLSQNDCFTCLTTGQDTFKIYTGFQMYFTPSCYLRYEYSPKNGTATEANIIISTVVSATAAVILVSVLCICFCIRRKPKSKIHGADEISMEQSLYFNFNTIRVATDNFSDLNKLGQGGFGPVYKGKLLNGQEVAVKRLSRHSGQGELEFKNEVVLVAKLQHRNLVWLLGFSLQGEEKLLIYELLPNTSLDHFIFDPTQCIQLDWEKRYKSIRGIARGLLYLHEDSRLRIIHRDLKASNVLLDEEMNPKISDFGMARPFVVDEAQNTNRIVGTYGYIAPEYALQGFFSVKSDVFSFGVLLLEIVSGRKNNSFYQLEHPENLLSYAWRHWREDMALELIDRTLRENCSTSEVLRCIHIGLLCVQENVADRPTMVSVDRMFNNSSINLSIPSTPAFFVYNRRYVEIHTLQNDMPKEAIPSINGATITELYPR